jgi:hypothetical protein
VPAVVPPAVVAPAEVAPVELLPDEPIEAFVRMNDAALPAPDVERDALVLPVVPVVPVAPALSPGCRQPVTVTVAFCPERFALVCCDPGVWSLLVWAAAIAVQPMPIANIHAARFIKPSCVIRVRRLRLQCRRQ